MALEIFRLVGSVFVDTDEANKSLQKIDKNAEGFGSTLLEGVKTAAKWAAGIAAAAGTAATALSVASVNAYADYEQMVGGVETLFKESANTVLKYAENAYKTAGLSANKYMEVATSFSASLLQGLNGDTVEAARLTDMAIVDMSDNANKFGTSVESLQNAYMGFAKKTYNMLDNLKLGYGGTQQEMYRLLQDAQKLDSSFDAVFSLDNKGHLEADFNDIVEAIHIIQTEMDITGTTSKEAMTTISGNISMIKAKAENLKTTIGSALAPVVKDVLGLVIDSLPAIEAGVNRLALEWIPSLINTIKNCCTWISENSDKIVEWTGYVVAASAGVAAFLIYLNWGTIMSTAAGALQLVTTAVMKLNTAMKSNVIGLVISLIVSLIAYLGYLYATNEEFKAFVDEMLSVLWAKLQVVFAWIEANVLPIIQQIVEWAKVNLSPYLYDLLAWIEDTLLPSLQNFLDWLLENVLVVIEMIISWTQTNLLPALQSMVAWVQENVIPVIIAVAGWIVETLVPAIIKIIVWVKDNLLPTILSVISWIGDTIGSFFSWLVGAFQSTSDSVGGIWEAIKNFFSSAWDFIVGVWEACQPFFQWIWDTIIMQVADLIGEMIDAFMMAWDVIVLVWEKCEPFFSVIWEGIKTAVNILWEWLSTGFKNAWELIKLVWEMVGPYFSAIWETIKAVFSVVSEILGGFFRTAWEVIEAVWNVVIDYFTMVWAGIEAVFAVVKGVLSGDFSDAWEAIKDLWNRATEFFDSIWSGIKEVFGSVGSWFGDTFNAAWEAVKSVFSTWGSFFGDLWEEIKEKFSDIGTNISDAISKSVKAGLNGVIYSIEKIINGGIGLINDAIWLINEIPGVSIDYLEELELPRLAKGGVVQGPTIAQIGEDGAEAVVPLERNTGWIDRLAGKVAYASTTQNDQGNNEQSLDKVLSKMDELLEALQASQTITLNKREFGRIVKEVG